ncbi:hypothetical protein [Micromonospora sonneratiae]|uniref:Uncharacterized protein n=1 Tax=Micromonospora sonneratiae TaxID=1184706 RepID=A0ABW3YER7_9ACTN
MFEEGTPEATRRPLADGVTAWLANVASHGDRVSYETRYLFPGGEEVLSRNELRFRSYAWLRHALADNGFALAPMDFDTPDLVFLASPDVPRRVVALRIEETPAWGWQANLLYDDTEAVTVSLDGLDALDWLAKLRELGVPVELINREVQDLGIDWDPEADVRLRSEADMEDWRRRDREHREQLKRDFLRQRNRKDTPAHQRDTPPGGPS